MVRSVEEDSWALVVRTWVVWAKEHQRWVLMYEVTKDHGF